MKKMIIVLAITAGLATAIIATRDAATQHTDDQHQEAAANDIYAPAMQKMHADMMVPASGDPDIDFVRGMIPHHEGAVAMAKILKQHGKDPELQKMADDIISAQEKEIAFMHEWLKKNGH